MRSFGSPGEGLVAGIPRHVRSDEYAVWTPFIQIAVNNQFNRINTTSVYKEDLRNFNALPIRDWAMVFKPQFWLFFLIDPAFAFSFYHTLYFALFLIGYYLLTIEFGFPKSWAVGISLLLFFTSYVQYWWTTTGPVMSIYPWILIIFISKRKLAFRFSMMLFMLTFMLLAHLYVPLLIAFFYSSIFLLLAFYPNKFKISNSLPMCIAVLIAGALAYIYLKDPIEVMSNTVYPGKRVSIAGTVPWPVWVSLFFPFFPSCNHVNLVESNICETGSGGSYLFILVLLFLDYKRCIADFKNHKNKLPYQIIPLILGFVFLSSWMITKVPPFIGKLLFLDNVHPPRMLFPAGILITMFSLVLLKQGRLLLSWFRFILFALIVCMLWIASKNYIGKNLLLQGYWDIVILLPLFIIIIFRKKLNTHSKIFFIYLATIINAFGFGDFNPIQSSKPIFHRPETAIVDKLERLSNLHPEKWIVMDAFPGATLNGYGFKSITHVLIEPQLEFFRQYFKLMNEKEFNRVFNRYAHVKLRAVRWPISPYPDVIHLPIKRFDPIFSDPELHIHKDLPKSFSEKGAMEKIVVGDTLVQITGWCYFIGTHPGRCIGIEFPCSYKNAVLETIARHDVIETTGNTQLLYSGFQIKIESDQPCSETEIRENLAIISHDPNSGTFLLKGCQSRTSTS
ncbi:hypothetical protein JW824_00140 [bacterium]|nr:hypothetical protein [bacterium]